MSQSLAKIFQNLYLTKHLRVLCGSSNFAKSTGWLLVIILLERIPLLLRSVLLFKWFTPRLSLLGLERIPASFREVFLQGCVQEHDCLGVVVFFPITPTTISINLSFFHKPSNSTNTWVASSIVSLPLLNSYGCPGDSGDSLGLGGITITG